MIFSRAIFPALLLLTVGAAAQDNTAQRAQQQARENQQFRQAQVYQRSNQYDNAIRILKMLYERNPGNLQYYQELLDSYLEISRTEEARQLVADQRAAAPPSPRYDIDDGRVLYKMGQKEEARKLWNEVLANNSQDVMAYTLVAEAMTTNRMYNEAAEVYQQAYRAHPDQFYLLKTLADFYRRQLNYRQALSYYFEFVRRSPAQYPTVVSRILSFPVEGERADSLMQFFRETLSQGENSEEVRLIAAKFFQKFQHYDEALEIYEKLEDSRSNGKYFFEFAEAVSADSLYALALRAYQAVIDRFPRSRFVMQSYLGAVKCNLELARSEESQDYAGEALRLIDKVKALFSSPAQLARIRLLEGDIYRQYYFDMDRAIAAYGEIAKNFPENRELSENARLRLAQSYMVRGNLDEARSALQQVESEARRPEALLYLAKIAFYQGDYQQASAYLNEIIQAEGFSGTITNDALDLQNILANEKTAPEALRFYAQADWLLFQQKKSEAVGKLSDALQKPAPPYFRSRMIFEAARLSGELGKYAEALDFCAQMLQDPALALYADQALFTMAGIFDHHLQDLPRAFELYDRLLAEFPESTFALRSRQRLKEIRRENPEVMP